MPELMTTTSSAFGLRTLRHLDLADMREVLARILGIRTLRDAVAAPRTREGSTSLAWDSALRALEKCSGPIRLRARASFQVDDRRACPVLSRDRVREPTQQWARPPTRFDATGKNGPRCPKSARCTAGESRQSGKDKRGRRHQAD